MSAPQALVQGRRRLAGALEIPRKAAPNTRNREKKGITELNSRGEHGCRCRHVRQNMKPNVSLPDDA